MIGVIDLDASHGNGVDPRYSRDESAVSALELTTARCGMAGALAVEPKDIVVSAERQRERGAGCFAATCDRLRRHSDAVAESDNEVGVGTRPP